MPPEKMSPLDDAAVEPGLPRLIIVEQILVLAMLTVQMSGTATFRMLPSITATRLGPAVVGINNLPKRARANPSATRRHACKIVTEREERHQVRDWAKHALASHS